MVQNDFRTVGFVFCEGSIMVRKESESGGLKLLQLDIMVIDI